MAEEKKFEEKVKKYLKEEGCWVLKTWSNGVQRKGIPDLLVCCNGFFLGVELKASNGSPTELQLYNIRKIRESSGLAIVLYPNDFERFKQIIKDLKSREFHSYAHAIQGNFDKEKWYD